MQAYVPVRDKIICKIPIFCRVNPLKRPRLNKNTGSIYQPKDDQAALVNELANYIRPAIKEPIIVDMVFEFEPGKTISSPFAVDKKFGDIDNLEKSILDALVHMGILDDDRFVVGISSYKGIANEDFGFITIWSCKKTFNKVELL